MKETKDAEIAQLKETAAADAERIRAVRTIHVHAVGQTGFL
jgi:hypothetical protein